MTVMKSIYIFKVNALLSPKDLERLREDLQWQLEEGLVLLNGDTVSYIGGELESCGHTVSVELKHIGQTTQ